VKDMSGQEDFDNVMDNDEYVQQLMSRYADEKNAMVSTLAALTKRVIQITPNDTKETIKPQGVLSSITQHLEIELCIRSMEEIDPNWKMKAFAEMALNPERMEQVLNEAKGVVGDDVIERVRAEVESIGTRPTLH
jgi:hypothetical protein